MAVLALDLGGTKLALAVFDDHGNIQQKRVSPLGRRHGAEVGALIREEACSFLRAADIHAIGICVPGIGHTATGRVWAPNIPGWDDYPLREEMASVCGDLPIMIDSDRACCILGETWLGAARGCRNAIFVTVGTGIGAGIMADGRILRGAHDIAGAVGWFALQRPYDSKYVSCGCFEYYASGEGIARAARECMPTEREGLTAQDVFAAYALGDPAAKRVLRQCVEFWGMAAANLISLFNPEKIIFGGGVFGPAAQFLEEIYDEACKWAQPVSIHQVRLEASQLGGDAGLFGAARLALDAIHQNCRGDEHV
jgi:glucokinase